MESREEIVKIVQGTIDAEIKALVGVLCKRVEVLAKEKSLSPHLYKALVKEHIYEFSRYLKKVLEVNIKVGKVIFTKARPKK